MRFEVHHTFSPSPEATALLQALLSTGRQIEQGLTLMSKATDHLVASVGALTTAVDGAVNELKTMSSDARDAGDEDAANKIDALVANLTGASTTASTATTDPVVTQEQSPSMTQPQPDPESGLTADEIAAGVTIDGSGNLLNADGTPYVPAGNVTG